MQFSLNEVNRKGNKKNIIAKANLDLTEYTGNKEYSLVTVDLEKGKNRAQLQVTGGNV